MDYEKLRQYREESIRFTQRLGITIDEIRHGYARVSKTVCSEDLNSLNRAHGGVYFTIADAAAGSAMASYGYTAMTLSGNYNFYRAASDGDRITAEAHGLKRGRTVSVFDVRLTDQNSKLLGSGTFSFYQLEDPLEIS